MSNKIINLFSTTASNNAIWTLTPALRWSKRMQQVNTDTVEIVAILQQKWVSNQGIAVWRDVPIEVEIKKDTK